MIIDKKLTLIIFVCILVFGVNSFFLEIASARSDEGENSVIVLFSGRADFEKIKSQSKKIRRKNIVQALKQKANISQKRALKLLSENKIKKVRKLWLINALAVTAEPQLIDQLKLLPGVEDIMPDSSFSFAQTTYSLPQVITDSNNLNMIKAPDLWQAGYTGQGITVASMGTGVDVTNPDLTDKWRGGSNSWFDVYGVYITPYDPFGHGTQTMGIMVAGIENNGTTPIGVAPDAQWIAVKIYNDAFQADKSGIIAGFQWLLNPGGDPNAAPDIVNISWGFLRPDECFEYYDSFDLSIQALKAADIAIVCAAGGKLGSEQQPGSVSPANYPDTFSVGAVNDHNDLVYDSSEGPSACDGSIYPNVVAPGSHILTTDLSLGLGHSYTSLSQTSAAAPHVSGAMALLLSAFPDATVPQLEWALKATALDLGAAGPDNSYGHGLIDLVKAYDLISVDLNRNQHIDLTDFSLLADEWLEDDCDPPDWCERADTDRDSRVNTTDLLRMTTYWLE